MENMFGMSGRYRIIIATEEAVVGPILQVTFSQLYPTAYVSVVPTGLEALMLYDQTGADLVLATENIGIIDSLELTRVLRDQNLDLPLIILSGNCAQALVADKAGVSLFLCCPHVLDKLKLALPQLLTP